MKTTWLVLLFALCAAVGVLFACSSSTSSGDDDQTNDDDNDASPADDDDNDDDDVSPGSLTVENVTQSACLSNSYDPTTSPIDVVQPSWDKGVLKIENLYAYANCGLKLAVDVTSSGNTVTVTETGTGTAAHCECPYNFSYEIHGIDIPGVTLIIQRQDLGATTPSSIFQLELPLGAENKQWLVPLADAFMAGDPTVEPFTAKYAGCDYYHYSDAVFMVRQDQDMYHVFSYDWYDLDNPGNYDPTCHMPVPVTIGTLAAGNYNFGAPSCAKTDGSWSMLTFAVTIP
jgi:hypothetical protein